MSRARAAVGAANEPLGCGVVLLLTRSTQRIDHFNPQDLRTFQLRYWVNEAYYKPGGPVFLMLGGESTGACVSAAPMSP